MVFHAIGNIYNQITISKSKPNKKADKMSLNTQAVISMASV